MKRIILALALTAGLALAADDVSALLQKGIYTQDTLGDLEGAIKIYRQIVAQSKESRTHSAQAQLRLGQCLLRKGQQDEARQVLEKLIEEYPEQKEVIAKARELAPGDLKLLPEPWQDGEVLAMDIKLPGGATIGQNLYVTESIEIAGKRGWRFTMRQYIPGSDGLMLVDVERDTFRPVRASMKHTMLGNTEIEYETNSARIRKAGKSEWERIFFNGLHYDNTQVHQLVRRLPLAVGYKIDLPDVTPMGLAMKFPMEVTGRETVATKAGKFDAFKVEFTSLKQTMWVAADSSRSIVKWDLSGALGELVSVRKLDKFAPVQFRDASGLAFTAPQGWFHWLLEPKPDRTLVHLLDPEASAMTTLGLFAVDAEKNTNDSLLADMKERSVSKAKEMAGYAVRPDSWKSQTQAGRAVAAYVADFKERDKPMVELVMWTQGAGKRTILQSRMDPANLAQLQGKLDAIFASTAR